MTFCPNCGASQAPNLPVCPRCGKKTGAAISPPQPFQPYQMPHRIDLGQPILPAYPQYPQPVYPAYPAYPPRLAPAGTNTLAVVGFVLALLPLPFAGLVLCVLGLVQCGQTGQRGKGLAVAGIVIRVIGATLLVIGIAAAVWYFADTGFFLPDYWEWDEGFAFTALCLPLHG